MPLAPNYSASDFLAQFLALLPQGDLWPRESSSTMVQALATLMPTYERQAGRGTALLADLFPPDANMMLPDWERSLGLPDPCAGPEPTVALRQAQVVMRLATRGGDLQSREAIIEAVARLGFNIAIEATARPFQVGYSAMGAGLGSEAWFFVWNVIAPLVELIDFRTGINTVGSPLRFWGNDILECVVEEFAPAHTVVEFTYAVPGPDGAVPGDPLMAVILSGF